MNGLVPPGATTPLKEANQIEVYLQGIISRRQLILHTSKEKEAGGAQRKTFVALMKGFIMPTRLFSLQKMTLSNIGVYIHLRDSLFLFPVSLFLFIFH